MKYAKIKDKKRPVVLYFPVLNYSFLRQRPQQIMSQFAKNGYTVLFCNMTQSKGQGIEEVEPNLFVVHDFDDLLIDIKYNKIKVDIAYATWAKSSEYFDRVKAKTYIYDSLDNFSEWHKYEPEALNKADIVLTSSQELYDMRSKVKEDVVLVRNACPSEYLDHKMIKPKEFENIDYPIISIVGAWGNWCRNSLLKKVANKYKVFFIGMEFGNKLPEHVVNLGVKDHSELPNYYYHSDICLIPFNTNNPVTISANPVKMYESMSCGTLQVATSWAETELYPEVVYTGKTDEEFMEQLDRAVSVCVKDRELIRNKARQIASDNTWEVRFNQIQSAINNYNQKNGVALG